MDGWISLVKGPVSLHISYGSTYTNNLIASDIRVRTSPDFTLSLDLDRNLKARDKQSNAVGDAEELLGGGFNDLAVVQLISEGVVRRLGEVIRATGQVPKEWLLKVALRGERTFTVRPEPDQDRSSLCLYVLGPDGLNQGFPSAEALHE